jgi:hypothetical protein
MLSPCMEWSRPTLSVWGSTRSGMNTSVIMYRQKDTEKAYTATITCGGGGAQGGDPYVTYRGGAWMPNAGIGLRWDLIERAYHIYRTCIRVCAWARTMAATCLPSSMGLP